MGISKKIVAVVVFDDIDIFQDECFLYLGRQNKSDNIVLEGTQSQIHAC